MARAAPSPRGPSCEGSNGAPACRRAGARRGLGRRAPNGDPEPHRPTEGREDGRTIGAPQPVELAASWPLTLVEACLRARDRRWGGIVQGEPATPSRGG